MCVCKINYTIHILIPQDVLKWHEEHIDLVGSTAKLNADCIIHATLEDDKATVETLYSYGYRLGPDTDQRINKVQTMHEAAT